jgi:hypothetical protein
MSQQLDQLRMDSKAWRDGGRPLVTFAGMDARAIMVAVPLIFIFSWFLLGVVVLVWIGLYIALKFRLSTDMALRKLRVILTTRRKLLKPWYCKQ